jgi:hypothetical protein
MSIGRGLWVSAFLVMIFLSSPLSSQAWHDETHIAIAKVAGYHKWFNATGADMAKLKAGDIERHNHYVNNSRDTLVTPEMVLEQSRKYHQIDESGHLYGAIIASLRDYIKVKKSGKYAEYHLAYCAHYVSDLSQPLHNTAYNDFNRKYHQEIDGIINDEVLKNLGRIKIYPLTIESEEDLATEIAKIANDAKELGYKLERENRLLTKDEAYWQLSRSASLFRAILDYVQKLD